MLEKVFGKCIQAMENVKTNQKSPTQKASPWESRFRQTSHRLDTFMGKCILFLKEKNFFQMDNSEMRDTLTKDFRSKLLKSDKNLNQTQ